MTTHKLRIVVEKVNSKTDKVVARNTISSFDITKPKNIIGLGLRHTEQINLLQSIQDCLLEEQSVFLKEDHECCPKCKSKIWSNGCRLSEFHAIFTDHKIKIKKQKCSNCDWHSIHTIKSLLGTSVHPDLHKLQCEYGATQSFRKGEELLTALSNTKREVNNRERISRISNKVGEELEIRQKQPMKNIDSIGPAKELIVQVDGGHVHDKNPEKRSFEAMCAKVYRLESIIEITEKRNEIVSKNCAASAKNDNQKTMQTNMLRAAEAQGLTKETQITALADGAKNCWKAISVLKEHCKELICILDWFHIGKHFQNVIKSINAKYSKELIEIKSLFWNGKSDDGIKILAQLKDRVEAKKEKSKVNRLLIYLKSNRGHIANYNKQAMENKPYTSQVAESTVEHLINDRYKKSQKMQWSRKNAHNILQIRASMASNEWDYIWQETILNAFDIAA